MSKTILCVGTEIPGDFGETVEYLSKRTLLDADVVLFSPGIPYSYGEDSFKGKRCLPDHASFANREAVQHWRRELRAVLEAGRLVVVVLTAPETVFAATGDTSRSGTGRNAVVKRMVDEVEAYSAVPVNWQVRSATGREMSLSGTAPSFFADYWREFGSTSEYHAFLEGEGTGQELVKTRAGNRIVGSSIRAGAGAIVAIPDPGLAREEFTEEVETPAGADLVWTSEAIEFGRRFAASLAKMSAALSAENSVTPPPDWSREQYYRMGGEVELERQISSVTADIQDLDDKRAALEKALEDTASLRGLLYEQGRPLEDLVLRSLRLFGFKADRLRTGDSDFDAVFESKEGRFIGEVEGRDAKPVNVSKFSQLERNIGEDFERESVTEHAKGVLFGNAHRLTAPADRPVLFTDKCVTAARRLGVALVSTPDLFAPVRYLTEHNDPNYAAACRKAIFTTSGGIVDFPDPPSPATDHSKTVDKAIENDSEAEAEATADA